MGHKNIRLKKQLSVGELHIVDVDHLEDEHIVIDKEKLRLDSAKFKGL